jgi:hypothetical protein
MWEGGAGARAKIAARGSVQEGLFALPALVVRSSAFRGGLLAAMDAGAPCITHEEGLRIGVNPLTVPEVRGSAGSGPG